MAKKITRYEQILTAARERVDAAKAGLANCHKQVAAATAEMDIAAAELRGHVAAYEALEKALTPKPRKKSEKAEKGAPALKEVPADKKVSDALCVAQVPNIDVPCGEREDALIHDPNGGYASYHPFETATASRKPRRKKDTPTVINTFVEGVEGNGLAAEMES
jgi:hypothetical protein